jgi:hypothetical protein
MDSIGMRRNCQGKSLISKHSCKTVSVASAPSKFAGHMRQPPGRGDTISLIAWRGAILFPNLHVLSATGPPFAISNFCISVERDGHAPAVDWPSIFALFLKRKVKILQPFRFQHSEHVRKLRPSDFERQRESWKAVGLQEIAGRDRPF